MIRVLFVCMGNICRSPTAQGVFDTLIKNHGLTGVLESDSAGTTGWQKGSSPDARAKETARSRGYILDKYRAREISGNDFHKFDLILAMDKDNLAYLNKMCPPEHHSKLKLFLTYGSASDDLEVPDPYYGGKRGFELVLELVEDAGEGLMSYLKSKHQLM